MNICRWTRRYFRDRRKRKRHKYTSEIHCAPLDTEIVVGTRVLTNLDLRRSRRNLVLLLSNAWNAPPNVNRDTYQMTRRGRAGCVKYRRRYEYFILKSAHVSGKRD